MCYTEYAPSPYIGVNLNIFFVDLNLNVVLAIRRTLSLVGHNNNPFFQIITIFTKPVYNRGKYAQNIKISVKPLCPFQSRVQLNFR